MARRDYAGAAVATTITSPLTSATTTIPITASTGWPSGTNGKFLAVIDRGLATEEKVWITSRSTLNLTVASVGDRGAESTNAQSHSSGATIEHCGGSTDPDEANDHINTTTLDHHTQYLKASTAAGNGLTQAARVLAVNVDGSTIEIAANALRLKALGVAASHMTAGFWNEFTDRLASATGGADLTVTATTALTAQAFLSQAETLTRAGQKCFLAATVDFEIAASSGTIAIGQLYVDGASAGSPQIILQAASSSTERATVGMTWAVTGLSVAAHTFEIRLYKSGANTVTGHRGNSALTVMVAG